MSAIAKTIWIIESRFAEPVSLDEMAEHAGISRSHLSRIFPIATGYSISEYIRGRRLSEAAKALADGAPDILGVALGAGYGSHEAFTRAFREQFSVTPDELRKRRSLSDLELVEPLRMDEDTKTHLDQPVIEARPALRLAGLLDHHSMAGAATIPAQWQKFQAFIGNVPGAVPGAAYGVVGRMDEGSEGFDYICAVEVSASAELPKEFKLFRIPAQKYARFTHKGHISSIRATCAAIYEDWLPVSDFVQGEDFSFIEYYGPDFDPVTGMGTVEIWIGLKP